MVKCANSECENKINGGRRGDLCESCQELTADSKKDSESVNTGQNLVISELITYANTSLV